MSIAKGRQQNRKFVVVSPETFKRLQIVANQVALRDQTRATMERGIKYMLLVAEDRLAEAEVAPASEQ